jgi:hypothetical protein
VQEHQQSPLLSTAQSDTHTPEVNLAELAQAGRVLNKNMTESQGKLEGCGVKPCPPPLAELSAVSASSSEAAAATAVSGSSSAINPEVPQDLTSFAQASPLSGPLHEQPLFNARQPAYELKSEKPEHRIVIFLKAQGHSQKEIAALTGMTVPAISYITAQPWAQAMILQEIAQAGRGEVEVLLQGAAADSIRKLIELRDDSDAPKEVQRKASNDLLDRHFGKPTQPIAHASVNLDTLSDAELAKLAQQGRVN